MGIKNGNKKSSKFMTVKKKNYHDSLNRERTLMNVRD